MTPLELAAVLAFFVPAYAADVSPIFARELFPRLSLPVDLCGRFRGRPIFGDHKTWRGVAAALLVGVAAYEVQRALDGHVETLRALAPIDRAAWPVLPGLLLGAGATLGDLVKSFFKRRLGIPPGASWVPFDQLDFFLGAWLLVSPVAAPPLAATLVALPIVFAGDVTACVVFRWLGLKETWI